MSTLEIQIPEDTLSLLETDMESLSREFVMLAAVKLFEIGRLSSGQAARLAGTPKVKFLMRLRDYEVSPFQVTATELRQEALNA
jgi:predicted HTH domain antitoxin